VRVTTDGVWIGYCIYWPLVCTTRNYILQITDTHILVSSVYYSFHLPFPRNGFTDGDSSASSAQVLLSQPPVQNSLSTENSTNWVPGWRPFHTNFLVISSQADFQLNWQVNPLSHQPAASRHLTQLNCWQLQPTSNPLPQTVLPITSRYRPHRKRRFHCYSPAIPRPLHRNRCLFIRLLHSNGCCLHIHHLATGLYATILLSFGL
jgi:hypothetical protein